MTDDTYQGWANRETWAFNLHWSNDQGLYNETLEVARDHMSHGTDGDYELGQAVVSFWNELISDYTDLAGSALPEGLAMFRDEVGSWWRVDYTETGAAVRESLSSEDVDND